MSRSCLLVHASTHGHTTKVAERLVARLRDAHDLDVALVDLGTDPDPDPAGADLVVVGASVHAGKHQREVVDWVQRHRSAITARANAFFSVSLSAADDGEEGRADVRRVLDEFEEETGWTPAREEPIAGALQYREYNLATRVLMRMIARRKGQPTDAHEDVDYTDWAGVDRFADDLAAAVPSGARA